MYNEIVSQLCSEVKAELENNILPFWMTKMTDHEHGGFYGRITGNDVLEASASKGAILNARILWTFSAAYRLLRKKEYLETATRAKRYLIDFFYDSGLNPNLGTRRCKGICPPSNPGFLCPERASCPLCPLPAVLPFPEPCPRPLLKLSLCLEPSAGLKFDNSILAPP